MPERHPGHSIRRVFAHARPKPSCRPAPPPCTARTRSQRDFGDLLPVPTERAIAASDLAATFALGERQLQFIDTPAATNGCIFDHASGHLYTGDTFGRATANCARGPVGPLLVATTTPVAFDPDAWFDSLDRMMALVSGACCLTHFGPRSAAGTTGRHAA